MNEPKLRFPEFKGEWEEKKLGDSFHERTEKNRDDLPLLSLGEEGLSYQSETTRKDNSSADKSKYLRVAIGDIAYNTMRMWQGRCVFVDKEGIVSPAYTVCEPKEGIDSMFHYYLFKTDGMIRMFHQNSQGLVSDTLNLKYDAFSKIKYCLPPTPAEQPKIASCLSAMDDLIAAQAEKVEALKEKKAGLMQQLFPQNGETTPRLRFPEFTGEWVEKNINDCFEFKQGVQCPVDLQALQKRDGYIRFIRIIDLTQSGEPPRYIADPGLAHHICKEDLFMVRYGSPGLVGYGYEGIIANNLFRLLPKFDMCTKFFKDILTALHKNIAALCGIGALPAINFSTLGLLRISLPPTIAEQQKIADCLSALDDQIAAETEKLTALKDYKKGLMQQLFPQPAK